MAVDYGAARTGVAFSDVGQSIAGECYVVREKNRGSLAAILARDARARGADTALLGLPVNMDGTEGESAKKAKKLAALLEREGLNVILRDERLTTVAAHEILAENGVFGKKRGDKVDAVAAAVILEEYLREKGGA
jgi:putative Holliday junction resolvase